MGSQKTILLTGATGLLGSNLCKALIERRYNVIAVKRSFSNTFRLSGYMNKFHLYDINKIDPKALFTENKIDVIIHCATNYGRKQESSIDIVNSNLILPLTLLMLASQHHVPSFINTDTVLDKRVSAYSLSKKQFYDWGLYYSDRIKFINIALEHFYGPFDDNTKFVSHMISSMLANQNEINLTKGEQKRDFTYIDDVVNAFLIVLEKLDVIKEGAATLEVGTGQNTSIKDLVGMIKQISGNTSTKLNFGALPYRENEVMESRSNINPILELGWKPSYSIEQGLKKTIEIEKQNS